MKLRRPEKIDLKLEQIHAAIGRRGCYLNTRYGSVVTAAGWFTDGRLLLDFNSCDIAQSDRVVVRHNHQLAIEILQLLEQHYKKDFEVVLE